MKLLVISFLALSLFVVVGGCSGGDAIEKDGVPYETLVIIDRSVSGAVDPRLSIAAKSATFDRDNRRLTIKQVESITASDTNGMWVVPKINVEDSQIIIPIPTDTPYHIRIDDRHIKGHYFLQAIKK